MIQVTLNGDFVREVTNSRSWLVTSRVTPARDRDHGVSGNKKGELRWSEVKLPVLMIALLVLAFVGLDGILLIIAKVLERATPERASKVHHSRSETFRIAPPLIRNLAGPRVETTPAQNPSAKEKLHEHACTG